MPPLNKPKNIKDFTNNPSLVKLNQQLAQDSTNYVNAFKKDPSYAAFGAIPQQYRGTPAQNSRLTIPELSASIGEKNNAARDKLFAQQQAVINQRRAEEYNQKKKTAQLDGMYLDNAKKKQNLLQTFQSWFGGIPNILE